MADVVISLGHADIEFGVAGHAELVAFGLRHPGIRPGQLVFTAATHAFHDLRSAGAKRQAGGQHDADRLLGAVGQGEAMADAFAVEIDVGLGGEGDVVELGGGIEMGLAER